MRGSATQEAPDDTAGLGFQVAKERGSRAAALRIVSIRLQNVIATVQAIPGVEPSDVTTGRIFDGDGHGSGRLRPPVAPPQP